MNSVLDVSPPRGDEIVLFDHPVSPCARRVRITLLEKEIPWERRFVDLAKMEQKRPEYLALNPNGVVPTILHRGKAIYESNVITAYLDDAFPAKRLYPVGAEELAEVGRWQEFELSFAKDYRPLMYQRLLGVFVRTTATLEGALARIGAQTSDPEHVAWELKVWHLNVASEEEQRRLSEGLYRQIEILEEALDGKDYLVGGRFTQADISVFPRVRMYPYVQLPIEGKRFPNVARWMARLERRPSFRKSRSLMETMIQRLSRTDFVPRLSKIVTKTPRERTAAEKLELAAARLLLRHDPGDVEMRLGKGFGGLRAVWRRRRAA